MTTETSKVMRTLSLELFLKKHSSFLVALSSSSSSSHKTTHSFNPSAYLEQKMVSRSIVSLSAALVLSLTAQSSAFSAVQTTHPVVDARLATPTCLHAEPSSTKRRGFLKNLRTGIVGAATLATFRKTTGPALAEELAAVGTTTGRVVKLTVDNLDGIPGKTGTIKIQLHPEWAPLGVRRFEELTQEGFFSNCRIFRVLPGFVAQFGINGDPNVQSRWRSKSLPDDPVKVSNTRGTVVFATAGKNSRTTQIFFNTRDQGNSFLDNQGFSPFGRVIEGMDIVDTFYAGYGEGAPAGKGPNQGLIQAKGNEYLNKDFPKLSYISAATFE